MPERLSSGKLRRDVVFSLSVLAREDEQQGADPSQFSTLVRHFFERFFSSELASAEGDAKTRLVQAACALGLPGLVISMYLYPAYHLPLHRTRSYWQQAGDHYFYVVYALVSMAIVAVFEWDLFFPDLLDVHILSTLPVRPRRLFQARIAAISLLIAAAIFDSNFLAIIVLPAATDPPHLLRFLAAHTVAIAASGIFGAAALLALEALVLAVLGERWFRKISLWLQGALVLLLLTFLFSWPAVAIELRTVLQRVTVEVLWFPPFWFQGIYQRILDGPATPPAFHLLARIGVAATSLAVVAAAISYPLAWRRRTRDLVEGAVRREGQKLLVLPAHGFVHATLARNPASRAIWHFIGLNLVRVPRYRMVLVIYGGAAAALVIATVCRLQAGSGQIRLVFTSEGMRAIVPMIAFLTVAGLRSTFLAPADQSGRWIFRTISGRPGLPHAQAAPRWVLSWTLLLTVAAAGWVSIAMPRASIDGGFVAGQVLVAIAASFLLTDAFFLNVRTVPFTGAKPNSATNLALLLIPYLGFFPAVVLFTVALEPAIEVSFARIAGVTLAALALHLLLRHTHRVRLLEDLQQFEADEDQEDFPLRLGLRY